MTLSTNLYILATIVGLIAVSKTLKAIKKATTKVRFDNKTVWITGASSGLGKAMAIRFAKLGASVILSSRNQEELKKIVENEMENKERHTVFPLDMSRPEEVIEKSKVFLEQLEKNNKQIDIAVENAGCSMRVKFSEFPFENHVQMTNLNYHGPVAHTKAILPHFLKNKSGQFVTVSSVSGKVAPALRTSYCGSKHAIIGFFDSLRSEVAEEGVSVTQLVPGYVQTNVSNNSMTGEQGKTLGKTDSNIENGMSKEKFCDIVMYAIHQKKPEQLVTNELKQDLGILLRNVLPNIVFKMALKNKKQQEKALAEAK